MKVLLITDEEYENIILALNPASHTNRQMWKDVGLIRGKLEKQAEKQEDSTIVRLIVPSLQVIFMTAEPADCN
jgi:hypothetical protein